MRLLRAAALKTKNRQSAGKPGSVWRKPCDSRVTAIPLGRSLPNASSNQPGRRPGDRPEARPVSWRLRVIPIRFCSRRGLPCRPRRRVRGALLPHPFTLTRPWTGGLLSVALSLGSPPPDVIRRRVSVEPGLSSPSRKRPSSRLTCPDRCAGDARSSVHIATSVAGIDRAQFRAGEKLYCNASGAVTCL